MNSTKRKSTVRSTRDMKNRALRRQHWNPNLTIDKSLPIFFFVGLLFLGVGSIIVFIFRNAEEVIIDYTRCTSLANSTRTCAEVSSGGGGADNATGQKCWCEVPFRIENDMEAPVFLYYGLTNFHPYHRKFLESADNGDEPRPPEPASHPAAEALPVPNPDYYGHRSYEHIPIEACNKVADSMFSDSLTVFSVDHSMYVPLIRTGIAWPDVKCRKGRPRRPDEPAADESFANHSAPVPRSRRAWDLNSDPRNIGFEHEDFIIWMEPAALTTTRKLYPKVDRISYYNDSLPKGNYQLFLSYSYPVTIYGGAKCLIIANSTILGSKNMFLGVAYVVTGSICLIVALIFFIIRSRRKKRAQV